MGAIAEAFVAYMQPLIDQTDGSLEQMNRASQIGHLCYNLALLPEDQRETMIAEMQGPLGMDDAEFDEFRRTLIEPMIRRHEQMFPGLHGRVFMDPEPVDRGPSIPSVQAPTIKARPGGKYPGTDRYAPCPCGSGEKYKFCCGARKR